MNAADELDQNAIHADVKRLGEQFVRDELKKIGWHEPPHIPARYWREAINRLDEQDLLAEF